MAGVVPRAAAKKYQEIKSCIIKISRRTIRRLYNGHYQFPANRMIIAELALLSVPGLPRPTGILAIILVLLGAVKLTGSYPEQEKRH